MWEYISLHLAGFFFDKLTKIPQHSPRRLDSQAAIIQLRNISDFHRHPSKKCSWAPSNDDGQWYRWEAYCSGVGNQKQTFLLDWTRGWGWGWYIVKPASPVKLYSVVGGGWTEGEGREGEGGGRGGGVQEVVNLKSEKQLQHTVCNVVLFTWWRAI